MSNIEIPNKLGCRKDSKDKRDYRLSGVSTPIELPSSFELIELYPPKNQFSRPSCTSNAQAHHKERQEKRQSSAPFVMALTKKYEGDDNFGASTRNTFWVVKNNGICEEKLDPEPPSNMTWQDYIKVSRISDEAYKDANDHKSKSFWRIENNVESIKQAIYQNKNSVVISQAWYREFNRPINGFLPTEFSDYVDGHATDVTGWSDSRQALLVKNSFGVSWGINGFYWLPYSILPKILWDAWTSLDMPSKMPVDDYYGLKRTWDTYMQEKSMAFNPWLYKKIKRLPSDREIKGLVYGRYSFEAVFTGKVKDIWLKISKMEAIKNKVIDANENIIA